MFDEENDAAQGVGEVGQGYRASVLHRPHDVGMPLPWGTSTTEAWLVPVEHWDNTMRADVVSEVGSDLPIGQIMKVHLGQDSRHGHALRRANISPDLRFS